MSRDYTDKKLRKPPHQRCVRVNITLPPAIFEAGQQIISKHKFSGYSEYLATRIRKDSGFDVAA